MLTSAFSRRSLPLLGVILAAGAPLHADTQTFSTSHTKSLTDWTDTLSLPQFDPSLGTLKSVHVSFEGNMQGDALVENFAPSRATVTTTLGVEIQLLASDSSILLLLSPMVQNTADLSAFDGTIDFAGTSGISYLGLSAAEMEAFELEPADGAAFAQFIGTGQIDFGAQAFGASSVTGSGNLIAKFHSSAAATLTLVYTYNAIIDCNDNGVDDAIDIMNGTSFDTNGNGVPDECEGIGDEGCTHGYWKNHLDSWALTGYSPADDFDTVFSVDAFDPDRTLLYAMQAGGGGITNLGRQGTAALLSAAHPGVDFPLSEKQVIELVQDAIADGTVDSTATYLDGLLNLGCPLN